MKIKAIAPWFGGKRNLAPVIVEELGPHRVYWEPFCGSMAVLMAKAPCVMETVNDLHGDLVNLARVIQHPEHGPRLYRRLRRTLTTEATFREAATRFTIAPCEQLDPERAYWYFVASWLGRSGIAGSNVGAKRGAGHSFCVRYTANGGQPAKRWRSAVNSIPAWRHRLQGVVILSRDGLKVLGRIEDAAGTALYLDPPYLQQTRSGFSGRGGTARYLHDFDETAHVRLAEAVSRFRKSRVVVSYYDDPLLAELYPGWTQRVIDVNKGMANQGSRGKKDVRVKEVLLINGASYAAPTGAPDQAELFT